MHFGYRIFRSSSLTIKHKSLLKALLLLHLIWTHASVICDVWGRGRGSVKYKDYCKVRLARFERGSMMIKRINKNEENAPSFWCGCGIASTKTQPGFSSSPSGCSTLLVWEHSTLVWGSVMKFSAFTSLRSAIPPLRRTVELSVLSTWE